jgi:hypothetical protein
MTTSWLRTIAYPRNKESTQRMCVQIPASLWDAAYSIKTESTNHGFKISFDAVITKAIRDFLVAGGIPIVVDTRRLEDIKPCGDEDALAI